MFTGFKSKILKLLFWVLLLCLVFILCLEILRIDDAHIVPVDIDNDGVFEQVILDNGIFTIWKQNRQIFVSDPLWQVTNYAFGDSNNDGLTELNLGFWRKGDYGTQNIYAKQRRDPLPGYHLYLYRYQSDTQSFQLLWGSSTLNDPLYSFKITGGTDNALNLLSVETGSYTDFDRDGKIVPLVRSNWLWSDWWFKITD